MSGNKADLFIQNITNGRIENAVKFPSDEDLEGAAVGLTRLQVVVVTRKKSLQIFKKKHVYRYESSGALIQ